MTNASLFLGFILGHMLFVTVFGGLLKRGAILNVVWLKQLKA